MATRNAATGKAQNIPPLVIQDDSEKQLFAQGQSHKQRKRFEAQTSLEKVPPTSQEAQLVHQIWLAEQQQRQAAATMQSDFGGNAVPFVHIAETNLSSTSYMHAQQRNVHFKIFGGYLMRSAYELAFMNASIFSKGREIKFLSLDALSFHLPVSIGSILSLTSQVTYTSNATAGVVSGEQDAADVDDRRCVASVVVLAELLEPQTGARRKSNTFHFSFDVGSSSASSYVLPQSYQESIAFIEGKRRIDLGNELRRISAKVKAAAGVEAMTSE